jgi:hypothetical protein
MTVRRLQIDGWLPANTMTLNDIHNTFRSSQLCATMVRHRPGLAGLRLPGLATAVLMMAGMVPAWSQVATPDQLKVVVVHGGVEKPDVHLPSDKVGKGDKTLEVTVFNELDLPQPGATVLFEVKAGEQAPVPADTTAVPTTGKKKVKKPKAPKTPSPNAKAKEPASVFLEGTETTLTKTSDADGRVVVPGVIGNKIKGPSSILVTATLGEKKGTAIIAQQNDNGPFWTKKKAAIFASVAGATAVILYETLKPGPPAINIGAPTASTSKP